MLAAHKIELKTREKSKDLLQLHVAIRLWGTHVGNMGAFTHKFSSRAKPKSTRLSSHRWKCKGLNSVVYDLSQNLGNNCEFDS